MQAPTCSTPQGWGFAPPACRYLLRRSVGDDAPIVPSDRCTHPYRGSASAAAALLLETVLLSAAIKKILRERAVQGHNFARGIARKEVEKPWFLPALLDTFPAAGKSVPCPEARNTPMGNLSYTVRRDEGAVERSGTSALGVHRALRKGTRNACGRGRAPPLQRSAKNPYEYSKRHIPSRHSPKNARRAPVFDRCSFFYHIF